MLLNRDVSGLTSAHLTSCTLARRNQSRGPSSQQTPRWWRPKPVLAPALPTRACPHHLPSANTFPGPRGQSTEIKSNSEQLSWQAGPAQSPGQAGPPDNPPCSALPGPQWSPPPTSSFLPGSREPCREGRSVMGAWSMPSLPSTKPLALNPQSNHHLKTPPHNLDQRVKVGLGELYANQAKPTRESEALGWLISRHAPPRRSQRPSGKGAPSNQSHLRRGKPAPGSPCPAGSQEKASATAPHPPSRATGDRQAHSNSSCRATPPALGRGRGHVAGSRQQGLARSEGGGLGKRRRGLDHGRALKPHSLPWSEIPTMTLSRRPLPLKITEPPRGGQQAGSLPASPHPAQRPHNTVCAEKRSAEQGVACLCCHRSWRSGTLLPHSGWAPGAWRPGEGEHRGGF